MKHKPNKSRKSRSNTRGSLQPVDGRLAETIAGLKAVKLLLDTFLEKGRAAAHKDMWEVSPGLWISNDFKTLDEALSWLKTVLPEPSIVSLSDQGSAQ